jgi:CBS domain-containing protein
VVDEKGVPLGVVSDKDVAAYLKGKGGDSAVVADVMSSPAITIRDISPIAYAAGKMLQYKVHRLVVVDQDGKAVAMLTRTDVFQPLMPDARKEDAATIAKVEQMAAQAKAAGTAASTRLEKTLTKIKEETRNPQRTFNKPWGN